MCRWPLSGGGMGRGSSVFSSRMGASGNIPNPMVPLGEVVVISSLLSSVRLELWKMTSAIVGSSVGAFRVGRIAGLMAGIGGTWLIRLTSALAKGLVPRPGIRTSVAPLLPLEHPTAMPYSEAGSKCWSRPVGLTKVTGQPKGNRNLVLRSGAVPVIISWLEAKFSIVLVLWGLQLAVSTHDSTA